MPEKALCVNNIAAGYGSANVIADIEFDIDQGETFGLIGLNGAGKTTLIKTILGLKDPSQGKISVAGHSSGTTEARTHIAYLPERFDPAWFLNAYEFINFSLSLYRRKVSRDDIDRMAVTLGLDVAYLSKRAQAYSKGMRQKLGLMTVFLTDCPLLVLDEPMSGLDPLARAQVKGLIMQSRAKGQTIFICSHILSDMEELCDRIAIMHRGRLVFQGAPKLLLEQTTESHLEKAFLKLTGLAVSERLAA
jgi:ABC-2 type transport system ATP-binding protein